MTNLKFTTIVFSGLILVAVGVLTYLYATTNKEMSIAGELTVSQAKQRILENSKAVLGRHSEIRVGSLVDNAYFKRHFIFEVYDQQRVPENRGYVAVDRYTGDVFKLYLSSSFEEALVSFNKMAAAESILINDSETAKAFLALFFRLTSDPRSEIKLLSRFSDIPFKSGRGNTGKDPFVYNTVITPPNIVKTHDGGFRVGAFTWSYLGGVLTQWELIIKHNKHKNIHIQILKREIIDKNIGDYFYLL